ncbi:DUF5996 family protein [Mycobacterium sp. ITM-2016-00318]|uniref:DUF5996 family protein n=1 Tax=Mycobacterium sp. ITM-2016-00318 TaxID=2099693 RepID=UPI000CF8C247|nr:DUF5996 family protein [Mycobacterium sp. ITM-2016-00318]WNG93718.1 DUF5996 family protein [Mycobacterium sp. ITM-2016-00318]
MLVQPVEEVVVPESVWPKLPVAEWIDTRDTLQLMTQVVGKVRLANTPLMSHWWNVVLYVSARGLTTGLIPHDGRAFSMEFDFIDHQLVVLTTSGDRRTVTLQAGPVSDFYGDVMAVLDELGLSTDIWTMPVEIPDAVPLDIDQQHVAYDGDQAHRFWLALVQMNRVFEEFRSRYIGKVSPVHFFWGALDLAVTRFSGRTAPKHPGGAPNCGPHVMWEAYSHEVSSAGYWPGPDGEGVFYSYAYPEPEGYRDASVSPAQATFDEALGEFVLPYTAVREADDPDAVLLEFLQSTYDVAADLGRWDREALERR